MCMHTRVNVCTLRPRGSTGDSQLHCHLLSGGAGWEDTDTLPQPPHRHHCQTQHMGSCTGKTVHIALCDTVLHCVRHHCQTQHMGSCTGEPVHKALYCVTPCYTVLHCVRQHCQTQHMGSYTGETVHTASLYSTYM